MARRELGPSALTVAVAVRDAVTPVLAEPLAAGRSGLGQRPVSGLVVAVSGGADSLALAAAAAWCVRRDAWPGVSVTGLVVDHGLQPDSAEVAAAARATVVRLGLPCDVVAVDVVERGDGPEAAARVARYRALLADRNCLVLLGHTRDDQAESVLLGLARGSGTRSLAGMAVRSGRLVRPLLSVPREVTRAACEEQGIAWWDDPHNADPDFARVRARNVMADLESALGPGIPEALARTAALCRVDADLLDSLGARVLRDAAVAARQEDPASTGVSVSVLAEAPAALRQRALLGWLRREGMGECAAGHVRRVVALILDWHGQAGVDVPGGRVVRQRGRLEIVPHAGR